MCPRSNTLLWSLGRFTSTRPWREWRSTSLFLSHKHVGHHLRRCHWFRKNYTSGNIKYRSHVKSLDSIPFSGLSGVDKQLFYNTVIWNVSVFASFLPGTRRLPCWKLNATFLAMPWCRNMSSVQTLICSLGYTELNRFFLVQSILRIPNQEFMVQCFRILCLLTPGSTILVYMLKAPRSAPNYCCFWAKNWSARGFFLGEFCVFFCIRNTCSSFAACFF